MTEIFSGRQQRCWSADTVASVYRCPWVTVKSWEVYCLQGKMWIMQTMRYCSRAQTADLTHALSAQTQNVVQHTIDSYSPPYTTSLNYLLLLQETSAHPGHSVGQQISEDGIYVQNAVLRNRASHNPPTWCTNIMAATDNIYIFLFIWYIIYNFVGINEK